jgi:hypothetical protein
MKLTKRQALAAYVALAKADTYDDESEFLRNELAEFLTIEESSEDSDADDDDESYEDESDEESYDDEEDLDDDSDEDGVCSCPECYGCDADSEEDEDSSKPATTYYNVVSSTQLLNLRPMKVLNEDGESGHLSFSADEDGVYALFDIDARDTPITKIAVSLADKQIEIRLQDSWEVYSYTKFPKSWADLLGTNAEYVVFGIQNDEEEDDE